MTPPGKRRIRRRYSLTLHLSALFSVVVLAAGASVAWVNYLQSRQFALEAADQAFMRIGRETKSSLAEVMRPETSFAELLALQPEQPVTGARTLAARLKALPMLARTVSGDASIDSVYLGYNDGSFFLLQSLENAEQRRRNDAPDTAAFMVKSVEVGRGGRKVRFIFFDAALRELKRKDAPEFSYDPRQQSWYRLAVMPGQQVFTEPYLFADSGEPGITVAVRTGPYSVIAVDAPLQLISERLSSLATLPAMKLALFDAQHRLLAHAGTGLPLGERGPPSLVTLEGSGDPVFAAMQATQSANGDAQTLHIGKNTWKSAVLSIATPRGPMYLGIAVPLHDLLGQARVLRDRGLLATAAILLLALPVTWWTARRVTRALDAVTRQAAEIRSFKFDGDIPPPSTILEADQLSEAMSMMRGTIRRFLDIASSLAAETSFQRLLERVVQETSSATGASGGLLYLTNGDSSKLVPVSVAQSMEQVPNLPLAELHVDGESPVAEAFRSGETALDLVTPSSEGFAFLCRLLHHESIGLAAIPLRNREGETVGVLALYAPTDEPVSEDRITFAEALSQTAAIAIETQRLLENRKALLDSFIQLLASAIDAKSPYTGGHCQRVPELTMMLARAACEANEGPFKDFDLTPEEWEALQIASWLHDCGKVTTPEYVVDKATKLETIYDRLHEVRMRFEVLKRDAELDYWKAVAAGGDRDALREELLRTLAELDEEFAFVAACNEGGEFMDAEKQERLRQIAARTWLRTLDDRIGISADEKARKNRTPPPTLPITERLLDDKPEHRMERSPADRLPEDDSWHFRLQVPELKYDFGELHNLSIGRGTLTAEERYVINHHIVQTIIMLSRLPFPRHLKDVPDIAGGHHEKMDGSGYPRGLKRDEMSVSARIMAIADIFEALTAADRPYKKGKKLSEAIGIMASMKRGQHIDPDLFDLFLASGVYRRYAERFLRADQMDEVDVSMHLGR